MIPNLKKLIAKSGKNETEIAFLLGVREATVYKWKRNNAQGIHAREEKVLRRILCIK